MQGDAVLTLNLNLRPIRQADAEWAERTALNGGLDCFSCHGSNVATPTADSMPNVSLRLQLWKQNHIPNALLPQQHHAQAVNADADAARRGHAVFERDEEIFVQLLLLTAGLMFQRGALLNGIVLLGVAGRNLLAVDAALEDFDGRRVVGRKLGERHEFLRQMRDEGRIDQRRLDEFSNTALVKNSHRAFDETKIMSQIILSWRSV